MHAPSCWTIVFRTSASGNPVLILAWLLPACPSTLGAAHWHVGMRAMLGAAICCQGWQKAAPAGAGRAATSSSWVPLMSSSSGSSSLEGSQARPRNLACCCGVYCAARAAARPLFCPAGAWASGFCAHQVARTCASKTYTPLSRKLKQEHWCTVASTWALQKVSGAQASCPLWGQRLAKRRFETRQHAIMQCPCKAR